MTGVCETDGFCLELPWVMDFHVMDIRIIMYVRRRLLAQSLLF